MRYRYYCLSRPPIPGAIPRGVVNIKCAGDDGRMVDEDGHTHEAWGFVEVERELTDKEVKDFNLERG